MDVFAKQHQRLNRGTTSYRRYFVLNRERAKVALNRLFLRSCFQFNGQSLINLVLLLRYLVRVVLKIFLNALVHFTVEVPAMPKGLLGPSQNTDAACQHNPVGSTSKSFGRYFWRSCGNISGVKVSADLTNKQCPTVNGQGQQA